ncbi:protein bangles and beads-like [Anopheles maculipalpis]|uniref:protein bangles and beads-like n=1 Tax=Anopheles maculipalpis TaxID=1496333 RepID=UPI002158D614|nr:protein bangles and beads-like [Anopheles maculipalpis]
MKLCLLIATAVAFATCYALPVPKEEVFAVYPVNSALVEHSSDVPVETKPEQVNLRAEGSTAKDLTEEQKVVPTEEATVQAGKDENKPEELKTVAEKLNEEELNEPTSTNDEVPKEVSPVGEVKSAPLKESTTVKDDESSVTAASTDNVPTTVANNDEPLLEVTQSVVAVAPEVAVPETVAVEATLTEKSATAEKVANEDTKVVQKTQSVESAVVQEKKVTNDEANKKDEVKSVESSVKKVPEEKAEKLTVESKPDVPSESAQARSSTSDLPAELPKTVVKPEEKPTDQVTVKVVVEPVEEKKPVVEQAQEVSKSVPEVNSPTVLTEVAGPALATANVLEPQTEGKEEAKPTKVRAAPIVEGLTVSQPVEAEPAVTKIHVTVIQEEVELEGKNIAQKEAVQNDAPVTEAEDKSTEATVTTTATPEKEVESDEPVVVKAAEAKDELTNDKPSVVKSVEPVVQIKPVAATTVEAIKEESPARSATTETVVIVVPSVKSEDVTTVVAVAENTDKPDEKDVAGGTTKTTVEEKPAEKPEVRSAAAAEEPATTVKVEEQQAKAVDGSSQPGASESSDTVKEEAKDQSDSISTTVSSVTELDTTTVSPVTTTDPEPVPTPAKQKAKKQVPPNLKGYSKRLKLQEAQRKQSGDNE